MMTSVYILLITVKPIHLELKESSYWRKAAISSRKCNTNTTVLVIQVNKTHCRPISVKFLLYIMPQVHRKTRATFRGLEVLGTASVCVLAPNIHSIYSLLTLAGQMCWCVQTSCTQPANGTSFRLEVWVQVLVATHWDGAAKWLNLSFHLAFKLSLGKGWIRLLALQQLASRPPSGVHNQFCIQPSSCWPSSVKGF